MYAMLQQFFYQWFLELEIVIMPERAGTKLDGSLKTGYFLEALVLTEPWPYIREIRDRLINCLNLQVHQVPGIPGIGTTLTLELGGKKISRVTQERFTVENMQRRNIYNFWENTVNM